MLKILVIGLGSMGKRRIRNLLKLGYKDIIGFDITSTRRKETQNFFPILITSSIKDALKHKPNVMIIATPPDHHLKYVKIAIKNNIDFFTEVNLISDHVKKILRLTQKKSIICSPSFTMHFHPLIKELKKLLQKNTIGKILLIQHHSGQYLPNWHPWEDYRKFFVSKKITGGAREMMPIELIWLTYLFNEIQSVMANVQKVSNLDVNIDDVYQVLIKFKNNISCTLTVDVLSIPSFRETKIIGEKGTILCDFNNGILKIHNGNKMKKISLNLGAVAKGYGGSTPPETLYEDEIKIFLRSVQNRKKYFFSFNEELKILKVLDAIEKSSKRKQEIVLK